jgi:acyl-homoserine-lactone acylase
MRSWLAVATAALGAGALGGCALGSSIDPSVGAGSDAPQFSAEIRRTAYGVPHIKANDYGGIGYGFGYASAEDNICEILDRMMTVTASRARFLGPGENERNIASDLYHQRIIDAGETEMLLAGPKGSPDTPSADARALAAGYVAGVNRYIRETGASGINDVRCKGQPWVRDVREIDFWRHMFIGQTVDSFFAPTTTAAPPSPGRQAVLADDPFEETGLGSNAYGLGREATKAGRGMVLGNPHYPWEGVNRFYRSHFIIPGKLNIVGVSYIGMPLIRMGHTDKIAWSNTVSTARRYGYYELTLDPADPTAYIYEGKSAPMERTSVSIDVLRDGALRRETRTLYSTRWGPVVSSQTFPWDSKRAFSLRTVRVGLRDVDQYMSVWQASDVRDLRQRLAKYQSYRFNTTAADSGGEALYGDLGMIPNVPRELAEACARSDLAKEQWAENRIPVLDGSRAACDWKTDADASAPGVYGPSKSPHLFRADYVTQSNDSYWLTNPNQPLTGFSPIWGDEETARSLRTRLGLDLVEKRIAGTDGLGAPKFDLKSLQEVMYGNRHLGAELARDDLVGLCRKSGKPKLKAACDALAKWDLRVDADSRGAHLFHLFAENRGLKWKVPFDPARPLATPNTLDVSDPAVLAALEKAVDMLDELNIPADARLGDVQQEMRDGERIPIHGGAGPEGVFNVISVQNDSLKPDLGWTKIRHGASWIMTVEFTDAGPVSQGILTYSESTNAASPHYSDQTRLYSQKGWDDLRFTEAAVEAGTLSRKSISE